MFIGEVRATRNKKPSQTSSAFSLRLEYFYFICRHEALKGDLQRSLSSRLGSYVDVNNLDVTESPHLSTDKFARENVCSHMSEEAAKTSGMGLMTPFL